ncbi:threonine-phosphate decarboxylase [Candidatus Poribacteria bacterium]|nr:threonine-phosphate decarboxylase [Candidatus Poribacteria bacterium]
MDSLFFKISYQFPDVEESRAPQLASVQTRSFLVRKFLDMKSQHGGELENIARRYGIDQSRLIDFSVNLNPLGPPNGLDGIVKTALEQVRRYPDSESRHLRRKLADSLNISEACVLVGNGATELIYLIARALRPKRTLIIQPTFTEYQRSVELMNGTIAHAFLEKENHFHWNEAKILAGAKSAHLVFLCNPNNPTGGLIPTETLLALAKALPQTLIVVDEAFIEFLPDAEMHSIVCSISRYPNLICLRSLTKLFAIPGLRLGYLVAQEGVIERLKAHKEPWTVNVVAQAVGVAIVGGEAVGEYLRKTRDVVSTERDFLLAQLHQIAGLRPYPSQAPYLLCRLEAPDWTARALLEKLLSFQLLIRDCSNFVGLDRRFFRVAVKTHAENRKLIQALKQMMEGEP